MKFYRTYYLSNVIKQSAPKLGGLKQYNHLLGLTVSVDQEFGSGLAEWFQLAGAGVVS